MPGSTEFKDLEIVWSAVSSVEQRNYNGDAQFVGTTQVFTYTPASEYGNLLMQADYANLNGTLSAYRGTKYEYFPNINTYLLGLPARQVTLDCTSGACDFTNLTGKQAETYFFYDGATTYTALPTKGALTKQSTWVKDGAYSQVSFAHYPNGTCFSPAHWELITGPDDRYLPVIRAGCCLSVLRLFALSGDGQ